MVSGSILRQGARGGGLTALGQIAKLLIQLAGVVVLSRLLTPEDFGLVAMVAVFLTLGNLVRDFGLPTAALSAPSLSQQQASNLFWLNSALAVAAMVVTAALTPLLVLLYGEERLWTLVPVLAVSIGINGCQSQFQVHLARRMQYFALTATDVGAQFIALVAAIASAMLGWGYWALVVQVVCASIALFASRAVVAGWRPARPRRGSDTRGLVRSGGNIGAAQLVGYAASNADTFMLGVVWGPAETGLYNRAFELLTVPITRMLAPLTQVVIPTVAGAAREGSSTVEKTLLRLQPLFGGVIVWIFVVSAAAADWLIPLLLGDNWRASVVLFQVLALGGCFQAFSYISYWAFLLHGQTRQLLHYNLVTKVLAVALIVVGATISVEAVAWAYSIGLAVSWPINLLWLSRTAGQRAWPFFRNGVALLLTGGVAFVAARAVTTIAPEQWALVVGALVASAVFLLLVTITPGGRRQAASAVRMAKSVARRG